MDLLLILLGIIWVAVSAVNRKKRKEAQEEAARKQAQAQEGSSSAPMQRRQPPSTFDPYFGGAVTPAAPASKPAAPRQAIDTTLQKRVSEAPQTRTREAVGTRVHATSEKRHTLEASSLTGHAHTESSLTGIVEECPPKAPQTQPAQAPAFPRPGMPAADAPAPFNWNVSEVTRGLVLAEILGKPKALKNRA